MPRPPAEPSRPPPSRPTGAARVIRLDPGPGLIELTHTTDTGQHNLVVLQLPRGWVDMTPATAIEVSKALAAIAVAAHHANASRHRTNTAAQRRRLGP